MQNPRSTVHGPRSTPHGPRATVHAPRSTRRPPDLSSLIFHPLRTGLRRGTGRAAGPWGRPGRDRRPGRPQPPTPARAPRPDFDQRPHDRADHVVEEAVGLDLQGHIGPAAGQRRGRPRSHTRCGPCSARCALGLETGRNRAFPAAHGPPAAWPRRRAGRGRARRSGGGTRRGPVRRRSRSGSACARRRAWDESPAPPRPPPARRRRAAARRSGRAAAPRAPGAHSVRKPTTCPSACTPASVRPLARVRAGWPVIWAMAASSSPWIVRLPGCTCQPAYAVPS